MKRNRLITLSIPMLTTIVLVLLIHSVFSNVGAAQPARGMDELSAQKQVTVQVIASSRHDASRPLRDLAFVDNGQGTAYDQGFPGLALPKAKTRFPQGGTYRLLPQHQNSPLETMPPPIHNFDGVGNVNNAISVQPPDTQGDIGFDPATGARYYMQWVNLSLAIWDVTDPSNVDQIFGPVSGNALFTGFGGPCEDTNSGDPIVLFDHLANRWLASQFALPERPNPPYYQCVAVSATANPTGAWYRYEIRWPGDKFNDYPKFGVWPDGYYLTVNQFVPSGSGGFNWAGAGVAALERDKMLLGQPANIVYFDLFGVDSDFGGLLPADLDGPAPPEGSPNFFMSWDDTSWTGDPVDTIRLWEFDVDWQTPLNSTFGLSGQPNQTLATSNVDPNMCNYARACIAQPDTSNKLDALSDRLMYRLQYRNYGDYQMLLTNHTVDVDSNDQAGIHWFELQRTTGPWIVYQEGLHAPDTSDRWMGSIAADASGNIALGYSVVNSTTYPSIRYAGRTHEDPLGTLPLGETTLIAGNGSQTSFSNRWGDYSMMGVDPLDDCTFWYTQEHYQNSGSGWRTRIGSFKYPQCLSVPGGTLDGTVIDANTSVPLEGVGIKAAALITQTGMTTTGQAGNYALALPQGTYTVTASAAGYLSATVTTVEISDDLTTTLDFSLAAPMLAADPISLTVSLTQAITSTLSLTLENLGSAPALYSITEAQFMPWLIAEPVGGLILPSELVTIQITLDAGLPAVDQPGLYTGTLIVDYPNPYGSIDISVAMNVLPLPVLPRMYLPAFNEPN